MIRTGRIVQFLGTCTDIDDRKQAEEKLRASEERLRLLTEAMPQIVWTAHAGRDLRLLQSPVLQVHRSARG